MTAGKGDTVKGQRPLCCCLPLLFFHCSRNSLEVAYSLEQEACPSRLWENEFKTACCFRQEGDGSLLEGEGNPGCQNKDYSF